VKTKEDNHILSATIMFVRDCSFRLYKVSADIRYSFTSEEASINSGWLKATNFHCH